MKNKIDTKASISQLAKRLSVSDDDLFDSVAKKYADRCTYCDDPTGRYLYIDNDSNILAMAHVDTVDNDYRYYGGYSDRWLDDAAKMPQTPHRPKIVGKWINSIRLDDRLGVHIVLDILPMLGVNVDVLLTDDEEYSQSTAALFSPDPGKIYNWGFSFDRRGIGECVMYQYSTDKTAVSLLAQSGWAYGHGSYSDIADLDIGCTCFNFSAGYWNEHSESCECHYDNVIYTARLFAKFYNANRDTRLPFKYAPLVRKSYIYNYAKSCTPATTGKNTGTKYIAPGRLLTPGTLCGYCNKNTAVKYDSVGDDAEPICQVCADYFDQYDDEDDDIHDTKPESKECAYCGCSTDTERFDEDIPGVCVYCADWLRNNGQEDEIEAVRYLVNGNNGG